MEKDERNTANEALENVENMGWIVKGNAAVQWKFKSEKWRFGPRLIKPWFYIC